ncbi:MAG: TolC family protein, partial [Caulobacteraceae bacterium]
MHTLRPRRFLRLSPLLACAGLAACLVGPDYRRPSAPTPVAYKETKGWAPAHPSDAADRRDWWTVFGDSTLNDLETRVATSNQTLAGAEAAYRQARALVAQQRAALFPIVSLNGAASVSGGGRATTPVIVGAPPPTVELVTTQAYSLGLGATWEPDLWGRVRRTVENARANADASAADRANTRLSLQMELADDYISLRQFDEQKRILDTTAAGYARSLTIAQNRYKVGVAAKSDVLSAQSQLQTTQADDADLVQQRARLEHAIAILTGQPPATLTLTPAPWTLRLPLIPAAL